MTKLQLFWLYVTDPEVRVSRVNEKYSASLDKLVEEFGDIFRVGIDANLPIKATS